MITVERYSGVHQGGTKEYHVYRFLHDATKKEYLIKRWGKVGSVGTIKHYVGSEEELDVFLEDRRKGGYDMRSVSKISRDKEVDMNGFPSTKNQFITLPEAFDSVLETKHQKEVDADLNNMSTGQAESFWKLFPDGESQETILAREQEEKSVMDDLKKNPLFGAF